MDISIIAGALQEYLKAHPLAVYALGAATGYAANNVPLLVSTGFHLLMKIPLFKAWVLSDPKKAKALIEAIQNELDKDIDDAVVKSEKAAADVLPSPPAPEAPKPDQNKP